MKVLIGVPHTGLFPYQTVHAMLSMRSKHQLQWTLIGQSLIYDSREQMAQMVIDNGFDYLFFLDSDMQPPPDIIDKLIAHDKPIVSAMAFKRLAPFTPCFFKKVEVGKAEPLLEYPKGLVEVEGVGMACCLIKREVLEQTKKPMFFPMDRTGEDLVFCLRAREAGFKIYVDTTLDCGHVSSTTIREEHFKLYWSDNQ